MIKSWTLKTRTIRFERTVLMGILNATPDSFSDGGRFAKKSDRFDVDLDALVDAGRKLVRDGAGILDVGGESTRPGSDPVDEAEELRRVVPAIRALKAALDVPISVDTYRPAVADAALESGADIVNDVAAGRYIGSQKRFAQEDEEDFPEETAEVAKRRGAAVVLMHMRGVPKTMQERTPEYPNGVVNEVCAFLARRRDRFLEQGVPIEKIAFDPGLGFGKTFEQNWELLKNVDKLHELGGVLLVGDSRKRFLAETARRFNESREAPPDDDVDPDAIRTRDFATVATTVALARKGVQIARVHNVALSAFALDLARRSGELATWRDL
ncbi:MAG: dihydropteroate synthase [Thermoguttaceae bacterium]|nr:dihydropteroate synthase [Thermoguttaceae bacterium]